MSEILKECEYCGKVFETDIPKDKWCSAECSFRSIKNKYKKTCECCGKEFRTNIQNKKYCTQYCAGKARHQKQAQKKMLKESEISEAKTEAKDLVPITEINVIGHQKFIGREIPVIEGGFGEGEKVVLAKTIAEIHGVDLKEINRLINDNVDEFEEGIDILDLKNSVDTNHPLLELGFTKQSIANSKSIYILSEQGYMTLVMLMRTEKAKELRKKFRREYFAMRKELKKESNKRTLTEEEELTLKIVSGKADATDLKKYRDIIQLKALDGENAFLNCTQVVNSLEPYVPGLTTVLLHEWLEFKGLGVYRKIGNERGRTFQPNEAYMKFIAGEGHALTRRTTDNSKIYVQYTTLMVSRIMKKHLSSLVQFVNSRL